MKDAHAAMIATDPAKTALPERLDLQEKMLSSHLDSLRGVKAALRPLYAALGDEQKKTADELIGPMGMM